MEKIESAINSAVALGASKDGIPGAVLAVVDKNGNYLYKNALGNTSVGDNAKPLQFDATYTMASCTKLIASITALQCVERGLITLDEPLDKHLPELAAQPIIEARAQNEGDKGVPWALKPATKSVTLRHLLTHSSGAAYALFDPVLSIWAQSDEAKARPKNPNKLLNMILNPRVFEAGEGWKYGTGLDWVGVLVGRLNNTTFGEYCEENIFEKLGMRDTTFHVEERPDLKEKMMPLSDRQADGTLTPGEPRISAYDGKEGEESGGAGLYSCVHDYTRVLADMLKEDPVLLKKKTVEMMFTPQFPEGSPPMRAFYDQGRVGPGGWETLIGGVSEGHRVNMGLAGLVTEETIEREDYLIPEKTLGWSGLPNLVWKINRERGIATFLATQVQPYNDATIMRLVQQFETAAWREFS